MPALSWRSSAGILVLACWLLALGCNNGRAQKDAGEAHQAQASAITANDPRVAQATAPQGSSAVPPDFSELAKRVRPGVVSLQVEQTLTPGEDGPLERPPEDFYRFFGGEPPEFYGEGLGTGFVIEAEGVILTNAHVVENASRIDVVFTNPDGSQRSLTAEVLGIAPEYDVALIKTRENANAVPLTLGDSDAIEIGDWVMAIGNPFGLTHSVSVGIISAKERREITPSGRQGLYDFLQTDASINPGNSGGPLVNLRGEVVGINAAINAAGQGIGFAIPINLVKALLPQLRETGRFVRSWLGLRVQSMTPELAESYGLNEVRGVLVAGVVPESPAAKAGLREGDVILSFNDKTLYRAADLSLAASLLGAGAQAPLTVWRDGEEQRLTVQLEAFPEDEAQARGEAPPGEQREAPLGLVISDLTPEVARQLGLASPEGVLVRDVAPGSPASVAGIRPGDVIVGLDEQPIANTQALARALGKIESGDVFRLKLERAGQTLFVGLKKP